MSAPALTAPHDSSAARWLSTALADFGSGVVVSLVPDMFDAYVRILHPGRSFDGSNPEGRSVTWAEIARAEGRETFAHAQWHSSEGAGDLRHVIGANWGGSGPEIGPGREVLGRLCKVLAKGTVEAEHYYFGIWTGWSAEDYVALWREMGEKTGSRIPRFGLPRYAGRDYFLLCGPLQSAVKLVEMGLMHTSPNYIWPSDKSWCLVTDIDFDSTLVGGSELLVKEIVAENGIEAWQVRGSDAVEGF
jgi:hypothetical protein